eukprot:1501529-Prymnesium_polylepis.1
MRTELVEVFVTPGINVDIEVRYPHNDSEGDTSKAGTYIVKGPKHVVVTLQRIAQGIDNDDIDGVISPQNQVTLPNAIKREAGIPLSAASFAFINPLPYFKRRLSRINLAKESWGFVFLLGGFAYFDVDGRICGVNSLSIVPSPQVLHLIGPHPIPSQVEEHLSSRGRLADVVDDGLVDEGYT